MRDYYNYGGAYGAPHNNYYRQDPPVYAPLEPRYTVPQPNYAVYGPPQPIYLAPLANFVAQPTGMAQQPPSGALPRGYEVEQSSDELLQPRYEAQPGYRSVPPPDRVPADYARPQPYGARPVYYSPTGQRTAGSPGDVDLPDAPGAAREDDVSKGHNRKAALIVLAAVFIGAITIGVALVLSRMPFGTPESTSGANARPTPSPAPKAGTTKSSAKGTTTSKMRPLNRELRGMPGDPKDRTDSTQDVAVHTENYIDTWR